MPKRQYIAFDPYGDLPTLHDTENEAIEYAKERLRMFGCKRIIMFESIYELTAVPQDPKIETHQVEVPTTPPTEPVK